MRAPLLMKSEYRKEWYVSEHYEKGLSGIYLQAKLNNLEDSNWTIFTLTYNSEGKVTTIICYRIVEVSINAESK